MDIKDCWFVAGSEKLFDIIYNMKEVFREKLYHTIKKDFMDYISNKIENLEIYTDYITENTGMTLSSQISDALREYNSCIIEQICTDCKNDRNFFLSINVYKVSIGYILLLMGIYIQWFKESIYSAYGLLANRNSSVYIDLENSSHTYLVKELESEIEEIEKLASNSKVNDPFISVSVFGIKDLRIDKPSTLNAIASEVCMEMDLPTGGINV